MFSVAVARNRRDADNQDTADSNNLQTLSQHATDHLQRRASSSGTFRRGRGNPRRTPARGSQRQQSVMGTDEQNMLQTQREQARVAAELELREQRLLQREREMDLRRREDQFNRQVQAYQESLGSDDIAR